MSECVHFIPASEKNTILAAKADVICAVAHPAIGDINHWCFYLASGGSSIKIDCTPDYSKPAVKLKNGMKASILYSRLPEGCSYPAEKIVSLKVRQGLTVGDIYKLLEESGRTRYDFDQTGVGCRFWLTNQIDLFYEHGLVTDPEEVAQAKEAITHLWPDGTPITLIEGAYW